ncbi:MAG: DegT/DnrJ/EryC1/StrS family aminotransferase [Xanthomonadales bacterium]|nr:DegT/DnrJ/EryC1/StrS family aminotransferase [Xanthomonadales bacterium]
MSGWRIPLARPEIGGADRAAVDRVLRTDVLSRGPAVRAFEEAFARWVGSGRAVAVSSGTAALHLALQVSGVNHGVRVVTSPFSVPASVNPILALGGSVQFVDIDPRTRALDLDQVASLLDAGDRVLAVHPFGQPAPVRELAELCARCGAQLIEDACEALGTRIGDRQAGTFGVAGTFGFYPNKQLTTGEGGMLITDDDTLADRAARLANHGRSMDGSWLDQVDVGYNFRLPETAAALGESQLQRLSDTLAARRRHVERYNRLLEGCGLILPPVEPGISWFAYVVQLPAAASAAERDRIVAAMADAGIQCGRYFAPLHLQPGLAPLGYRRGDFPVTEAVADRAIALPLFAAMTDEQIDEVVAHLLRLLAEGKRASMG